MEVLLGLLGKVAIKLFFKFHCNCKELKINNLCFTDDLMLFFEVEKETIELMKHAFKTFSSWVSL